MNLNYSSVELFQSNNSYYAYDIEKVYVWLINEEIFNAIQFIKQNQKFPQNINPEVSMSILKKIRNGLFFSGTEPTRPPRKVKIDTLIVSFPLVHECNLRCKYCFASSGDVYEGQERVFNNTTIDYIIKFITVNFEDVKQIRLEFVSGGEPLLLHDLFFSLITHFKSELELRGYSVDIFLLTNGTKLNESILDKLIKLDVALAVSIDGARGIHDFNRPFKDGKGSYNQVLKSVSYLQTHPHFINNFWIVSVITAKTPSLELILNHNKSLGVKSMEMRLMRGREPADLALNNHNLIHFIKLYDDFAKYLKSNPDEVVYILNEFDTFGKLIKRLLLNKGVPCRCTAGVGKFSFTADGEIYPCDSFVGKQNFVLGNIFDNSWNKNVSSEFEALNFLSEKPMCPCDECPIRYVCGSDCHYNSYVNNGSVWKKKSVFCEFQKHLFLLAIDLIQNIKNINETKYNYLIRLAKMQNLLSR